VQIQGRSHALMVGVSQLVCAAVYVSVSLSAHSSALIRHLSSRSVIIRKWAGRRKKVQSYEAMASSSESRKQRVASISLVSGSERLLKSGLLGFGQLRRQLPELRWHFCGEQRKELLNRSLQTPAQISTQTQAHTCRQTGRRTHRWTQNHMQSN
jgi:hypothetical protein